MKAASTANAFLTRLEGEKDGLVSVPSAAWAKESGFFAPGDCGAFRIWMGSTCAGDRCRTAIMILRQSHPLMH